MAFKLDDYVIDQIQCGYAQDVQGELLYCLDQIKDSCIKVESKNTEYKKPSLDELEEALIELKYCSQARKLNPDDELANRFTTLAYNNLKELINGYNRETEEKNVRNSLNCYKPAVQLPSVDIMNNFISEIGVSIAKLKEEAKYVTDIRFWEILQCVVNLESIMNNAIDLLEQIKEK